MPHISLYQLNPPALLNRWSSAKENVMRPVTNIELLAAAVIVLANIMLISFLELIESDQESSTKIVLVATLGVILVVGMTSIWRRLSADIRNVWLQPVSTTVRTIVINCIMIIWLLMIAALCVLFVYERRTLAAALTVVGLFIAGLGLGRYFQSYLSTKSLLPYGAGVFVTLFGSLVFFSKT